MNEIIKKNGTKFGIVYAVVSILITVFIYVVDVKLFVSWWLGLLSITITLTLSCVLLSKTKNELNGIFSFKEAFTTYFIMAIIGISAGIIFNIILFNFIDPTLKLTLKEMVIKKTVAMMEKFGGGNPADINKVIKKMSENNPYSVTEQLKGFVYALPFSCVLGLIFAAFFKSKPAYNL